MPFCHRPAVWPSWTISKTHPSKDPSHLLCSSVLLRVLSSRSHMKPMLSSLTPSRTVCSHVMLIKSNVYSLFFWASIPAYISHKLQIYLEYFDLSQQSIPSLSSQHAVSEKCIHCKGEEQHPPHSHHPYRRPVVQVVCAVFHPHHVCNGDGRLWGAEKCRWVADHFPQRGEGIFCIPKIFLRVLIVLSLLWVTPAVKCLSLRWRTVRFTSMMTLCSSLRKSSKCILGRHWVTTGAVPWWAPMTSSPSQSLMMKMVRHI